MNSVSIRRIVTPLLLLIVVLSGLLLITSAHPATVSAEGDSPTVTISDKPCSGGTFFGIPTWYQYLPSETAGDGKCTPQLSENADGIQINSAWLIALAVIDILLRLVGILAIGLVIFGGFKYITSQGSPDATKAARHTIVNAIVGIVIAVMASVSVTFVAKLIK